MSNDISLNIDKHDINQIIYKLNVLFGNTPVSIMDDSWKIKIENQVHNILDEITELEDAVDANDRIQIMDAYGDIVTFLYGVSFYFGGIILYNTELDVKKTNKSIQMTVHSLESGYDNILECLDNIGNIHDIQLFLSSLEQFLNVLSHIPYLYDFNPYDVLERVTKSNLTKFCSTMNDVTDTMNHYKNLGIEVYHKEIKLEYNNIVYVVYSSKEQTDINGKMYREGKFLKNQKTFEEPDFSNL